MHQQKRGQSGSIIGLTLVIIAVLMIPVGLFACEVARYCVAQQQLQAACDAAALSIVAGLASANLDSANIANEFSGTTSFSDIQNRMYADNCATTTFEQNNILGNLLTNTTTYQQTGSSSSPAWVSPNNPTGTPATTQQTPNPGQAFLYLQWTGPSNTPISFSFSASLDPFANSTPPTNIQIQAVYGYQPMFLQFVGVSTVPISVISNAGVPALDVVLCFDVSTSMDDQTPITVTNTFSDLTGATYSINTLAPPIPQYIYTCPTPSPTSSPSWVPYGTTSTPDPNGIRGTIRQYATGCAAIGSNYDINDLASTDYANQQFSVPLPVLDGGAPIYDSGSLTNTAVLQSIKTALVAALYGVTPQSLLGLQSNFITTSITTNSNTALQEFAAEYPSLPVYNFNTAMINLVSWASGATVPPSTTPTGYGIISSEINSAMNNALSGTSSISSTPFASLVGMTAPAFITQQTIIASLSSSLPYTYPTNNLWNDITTLTTSYPNGGTTAFLALSAVQSDISSIGSATNLETITSALQDIITQSGSTTITLSQLENDLLPIETLAAANYFNSATSTSYTTATATTPATGGPIPVATAVAAANQFVSSLFACSNAQVSAMSFNEAYDPNYVQLTKSPSSITSYFTNIASNFNGGGTNFQSPLDQAYTELTSTRHRSGAKQIIVFFTDGEPHCYSTDGTGITANGTNGSGDVDPSSPQNDWSYAQLQSNGSATGTTWYDQAHTNPRLSASYCGSNAGIAIYCIGLAQVSALENDEYFILNSYSTPSNTTISNTSSSTSEGLSALAGNGGQAYVTTNLQDLPNLFAIILRDLVQITHP